MATAPLNWLLKIGGASLKTTAQTLSEAVNALHDSVTILNTTKADVSTMDSALNNLTTNKLNVSDLLSLEEIEASTSLTGKGANAESVKELNESLEYSLIASDNLKFKFATDGEGNYGYLGADDSFIPFKGSSGISAIFQCVTNTTSGSNAVPFFYLDNETYINNNNILTCQKNIKDLKLVINMVPLAWNRLFSVIVYHNSTQVFSYSGAANSNGQLYNKEIVLNVSAGDTLKIITYGENNGYTSVTVDTYGYIYQ